MISGVPEPKEFKASTTPLRLNFISITNGFDLWNKGLDNEILISYDGIVYPVKVRPDEIRFFPARVSSIWVMTEAGTSEGIVTGYVR